MRHSTFFDHRGGRLSLFHRCVAALLIPCLVMGGSGLVEATAGAVQSSVATAKPSKTASLQKTGHVNHNLPSFKPLSGKFQLPPVPTDQEIFSHPLFEEPLIPIGGKSTKEENSDLAQALTKYSIRVDRDDFSSLESFLKSHPNSVWNIALLTDLGWSYRQTGWYSKALEAWQQAWAAGQYIKDPVAKPIVDRALAELIVLNARVGRMDELKRLIKSANTRNLVGSSKEKLEAAKQALYLMDKRPDTSFRCGPMAVEKLRNIQDKNDPAKLKIMSMASTQQGTNMAQLKKLALSLGMHFQVAKRDPGAQILVPAVVNWKVGHFASLIGNKNKLWLLHDPTFGYDVWISKAALDAESSGYFLVKDGPLPGGWRSVGEEEAAKVWGKGTNSGGDPNCNGGPNKKVGCPGTGNGSPAPGSPEGPTQAPSQTSKNASSSTTKGMAAYAIYEMLASLSISDTPLFYTPPYGPAVNLTVTYSQRESNQPSIFTYSNLGPLWTINWISYLVDDPDNPGADVNHYLSGGGTLTYTGYDSSTQTYAPQAQTGVVLKIISSSSYELDEPDGSKQIFSAATTTSPRKIFMTQTIDPQGNGLTFTYDSNFRLVAVTDALGQVTTLSYGLTNDIYKITSVTDPFGRTATFTYTGQNGQTDVPDSTLQSSTDIIGITSSYAYLEGALTGLTTPYGKTSFDVGDNGGSRWVQVTDPQGGQERVETWNNYNLSVPSSESVEPSGVENANLNLRNSFYWSKEAMMVAPGDYTQAEITHWLHEPGYSVMSGQIESVKSPLESRVWYNYPNQPEDIVIGSSGQANRTVRILDDGSSQQSLATYNSQNLITQSVDPIGRTTNYSYAANGIDLTGMSQVNGSANDILFSATYNSLHKPLTVTDASGQTTSFTYNSIGQMLTRTNPKGEVTTYSYTSGYLTTITGPQAGSTTTFGYDGLGRIASITNSDGYTLDYSYDNFNRVTRITYPDGTFISNQYTNLDKTLETDREGHWARYVYNPLEQLSAIIDSSGRVTNYDRCICGQLKGVIDPLHHRTSWSQDIEGRTVTKTYPDGTATGYAYENNTSRLKSVTDAKGQVTTYTYNKDDAVANISYTNTAVPTASISYVYDSSYPRLTSMTDGTGTTTYTYNSITASPTPGAGRLATETGPLGSTAQITYTYDELGRTTSEMIDGSGSSVAYDSLGRISSVTNALNTNPFTYSYYGVSPRLQTVSYPNGQSTSYSYLSATQDLRLSDITNYQTGTTVLSKFDYTYNPMGTISTSEHQEGTDTPSVWNYKYDQINQLTSAIRANSSTLAVAAQYFYGYDLDCNRTSEQINLNVESATFNNLNQKTGSTGGGGLLFTGSLNKPGNVTVGGNSATVDVNNNFSGTANVSVGTNTVPVVASNLNGYATTNNYQVVVPPHAGTAPVYDLNGNLTDDGHGRTYTWDGANELTKITYSNGASTSFTYDGLGRRVSIVETNSDGTPTSTKQFVWIRDSLAEERDASNTVQKRFFQQGEQIGGASYYYTRDSLGSVREMADSSGAVQARYDYDPFGRVKKIAGSLESDFQYAGYYINATSGLNLTLFRAYDSGAAVWLSRDPSGETGGLNLYAYVQNGTTNSVDPLGLCSCPPSANPFQTGLTVQVGFSANLNLLIFNLQIGGGLAFDRHGGIGLYSYSGGGLGVGADAGAGVTAAISNANTVDDLSEWFGNASTSVGGVLQGSADSFVGKDNCGKIVVGSGLTAGVGLGADTALSATYTTVQRIR